MMGVLYIYDIVLVLFTRLAFCSYNNNTTLPPVIIHESGRVNAWSLGSRLPRIQFIDLVESWVQKENKFIIIIIIIIIHIYTG